MEPKELIKQEQASNLLKNIEQYRNSTKPVSQISEDQRGNPIENQMEEIETADYQAAEEDHFEEDKTDNQTVEEVDY